MGALGTLGGAFNEGQAPIVLRRTADVSQARAWADTAAERLKVAIDLQLVCVDVRLDDGRCAVTVGPGSRCGFCAVEHEKLRLFIEVRPKVKGVDVLGLSVYAGWLPRAMGLAKWAPQEDRRARSLLALLLGAYGASLEELLERAGGLRRLHEPREETLVARRRGQIRVAAYLRNVSRGQVLDFPCRFESHELDNLPNRALRWALELLLSAAQAAPGEVAGEATGALRAIEPRLAGVPLEEVRGGELARLARLPQAFAQYESTGALPLARWIIERFHLSQSRTGIAGLGFSVDMAVLFEEAFARVVVREFGGDLVSAQPRWRFSVEGSDGGKASCFQPDVFVAGDEGMISLVLDTKWKSVLAPGYLGSVEGDVDFRIGSIALKNSDIFQICAYARLAQVREDQHAAGVLVYPVGDGTAELLRVRWARAAGDAAVDIPIYLLAWPVGLDIERGTKDVLRKLTALRQGRGVA